jgi:hypothetical protein
MHVWEAHSVLVIASVRRMGGLRYDTSAAIGHDGA